MSINLANILLQGAPPTPGGSLPTTFIMMGGMIAVMYFFMIRPQAKRAKEQKKFAESMISGEYVVTTAGIHGTISRANEDGTIQLEVGRGNFMKIERSAVSMEMTQAYKKKNDPAAVATTAAK